MDVQATKMATIEKILENKTYMPKSGVVERLSWVLQKLSKDDLGMLKLIIDIKVNDAATK